MKTKFPFSRLTGLFLTILLMGASCTQPLVEKDIKADIEKVNQALMTAINIQNADEIVVHYTDDIVMLPSNHEPVVGIDAAKQLWIDGFKHGMGQLKFITSEATAIGDIAYEHGIYKYYTPDNVMVDHGKYMVIWKKEGEHWKIAKDIWNSSMAKLPRATTKDTISMAITKVKSEHLDDLTQFATEIFLPAFNKHFPDAKATTRMFKVVNKKTDDVQLIYFIDPLVPGHEHNVKTVLSKHYSEEEVNQYIKDFNSYIIRQDIISAVPMEW